MSRKVMRVFEQVALMADALSVPLVAALMVLKPLTDDEVNKVRGILIACFAAHASGRLAELSDAVIRHGDREQVILRRMNDAANN